MKKSFRRWLGRVFDIFGPQDLTEKQVMSILNNMNKTNPATRSLDCFDARFAQLVPVLHHYDEALCFLEQYGYVCDTYFRLLKDAGQNAELQRQLCKVRYNTYLGENLACYPNLLCSYFERWDLLPEVKDEIFGDDKYQHIVCIYQMFCRES